MVALRLLLIAGILVCPFNCLGALGAEDEAAGVAAPKCKCCAHRSSETPTGADEPQPPDEESGCGTCLCHGAVSESRTFAIEQAPAVATGDVLLAPVSNPAAQAQMGAHASDRPPALGRTLRIWHQSFLL